MKYKQKLKFSVLNLLRNVHVKNFRGKNVIPIFLLKTYVSSFGKTLLSYLLAGLLQLYTILPLLFPTLLSCQFSP